MSGKAWTIEQRAKIIYQKHKREIIDSLMREGLISTPNQAKRRFVAMMKERSKAGMGLDTDSDVQKTILNSRVFKPAEQQVLENYITYLKGTDQYHNFRKNVVGWNRKLTYLDVYYDQSSKRYFIYDKDGRRHWIHYERSVVERDDYGNEVIHVYS